MSTRILVPCRMASTRLPGKALLPILGKPSIRYVLEACKATKLPTILITDHEDISAIGCGTGVGGWGEDRGRNGTERCSYCIDGKTVAEDDRFIIVAGDQLTVTPGVLLRFIEATRPDVVSTIVVPRNDSAVTTCEVRHSERGYRIADFYRDNKGAWVATGIYSYPAAVLRAYKDMPVMGFEQVYDVELSRVLHNGIPVYAHIDKEYSGIDLNYAEDIAIIEACLSQRLSESA